MAMAPTLATQEADLAKLVAYVGRYGNQPRNVVMNMPVSELRALARAVSKLLADENRSGGGNESIAKGR